MLSVDDYFGAHELGLEDLNPLLNVNISESELPGMVTAVIEVQENLKFHRDLDREKGDPHNQFFTLEGRPTEAVISVLRKLVTDRYNGEDLEIDGDEETEDDYFQFTVAIDVPADVDADRLGQIIWEDTEIVKFHNEADPGTFGAQYLFGSLMYEGLRALEV
jgi:hypothetical protein